MKSPNVTTKILLATLGTALPLALCLMLVMTHFMNSLTDSIMLDTLQPMARTAAQNVENRLHTLAERFSIMRENRVLREISAPVAAKRQTLADLSAGREYAWVGLYEPDGVLLTGSEACPRAITGRELFPALQQTGNLVIEKTSVGPAGLEVVMGAPVIAGYGPADDARDETAAYLVGGYAYDTLSDVLRDINIGPRGTAFIIDQDGSIIAHKDLGRVFSQEPLQTSLGDTAEAEAVFAAMTRHQTGSARITGQREDLFIAYSPIKGTLWSLGIQAPRGDFMGPAKQALLAGTGLIIAALVTSLLIMAVFNRRVLAVPLAAITAGARELARGNFGGGLPRSITGRKDEIGQLSAAFESMSASVSGLVEDIRSLTLATGAGDFAARAEPARYAGDFRLIVESLNASLDGVCAYLDGMPDALLLLDHNRARVYHNKAMALIMERHGLRAKDPALFRRMTGAGPNGGASDLDAIFEPGGPSFAGFEREVSFTDQHGAAYSYNMSLGRLRGPLDSVCVMLILNDVSALARARTQAEDASRAKGDFLSRMSHEMRTPMNAIIGMAAIGLSAGEAERKQYCLNKIAGASRHLLGIINDILDMSKIEAHKFELAESVFDPAALLRRVADVVRFQAEEKRHSFSLDLDANLPACLIGDEQRLAQVVTNLLGNAIKFTPENGRIRLGAGLAAQDGDRVTIRIAVIDNGIGLSQEQISRLFRPFEQADGGISRRFGGTGLGLAISKHIVESMGGAILLESAPGLGSTFTVEVTLPLARSAAGERPAEPPAPAAGGAAPEKDCCDGVFRGRCVLLAEDVEINREIVAALLERTELEIVFAHDGEEAVRAFSAEPRRFDLVLMDVQMPEVNGYEATRRIRSSGLPGAEGIPIIAMTANVFREDIDRCLQSGMNGHLGKPIDADEVIATLARHFAASAA